jgi:hypothetical protein
MFMPLQMLHIFAPIYLLTKIENAQHETLKDGRAAIDYHCQGIDCILWKDIGISFEGVSHMRR